MFLRCFCRLPKCLHLHSAGAFHIILQINQCLIVCLYRFITLCKRFIYTCLSFNIGIFSFDQLIFQIDLLLQDLADPPLVCFNLRLIQKRIRVPFHSIHGHVQFTGNAIHGKFQIRHDRIQLIHRFLQLRHLCFVVLCYRFELAQLCDKIIRLLPRALHSALVLRKGISAVLHSFIHLCHGIHKSLLLIIQFRNLRRVVPCFIKQQRQPRHKEPCCSRYGSHWRYGLHCIQSRLRRLCRSQIRR